MGVMLPDVVRALFPEHAQAGHKVTFRPTTVVTTWPAMWDCSCGHSDALFGEEVGQALREDLVSRT